MEKHKVICPYCGAGCQFNLLVQNGQVVGTEPINGITNQSELCLKGMSGYDSFIAHVVHSLLNPMPERPCRRCPGPPVVRHRRIECMRRNRHFDRDPPTIYRLNIRSCRWQT